MKAILDSIPPLQKVLHFNRDNEAVLTFIRAEEAKAFLEVVEKAPISLGNNVLTFTVKKSEKEKAQKGEKVEKVEKLDKSEKKDKQEKQGKQEKTEKIEKNQNKYQVGKNKALLVNLKKCIEVEEERKEPQKGKQDTSSVIWVRGIPENTPKEKLTALLENYSQKLKDIKIHNKKKRATFEFDSFILANEVLAFLTSQDRFIDEIKVTFEKATPPSSPTQVSKPFESLKNLEASSKTKEQAKPVQSKTGKPEQTKPLESQPIQASQPTQQSPPTSSSILKISNVPLEETSQEVGYLVRACNHYIRKTVEAKYFKDYVLFYFKTKEDAIKAFEFLIENNLTFKGKKLKVEYQFPMKKSSNEGSIQSKTSKGYEEGFPVIQDAQSLTYFQGNKNYDLGYGGNTFDQQREDQNILEILQSQQHPMFVNNIEQQSPVDPGKFSFNLGQKSNLQQSQDEIDRLIKMTEEQFQYDINFPSETFPDQLETKISMASSIHFTPQNTSMSFQESSPDFPHQQSQGQENVKQAAQINPRENSVFGFPQGQGQETQKNQPVLNTQAQQIRGPIPPTSIPQNFPQYPPQNFNQMEQQGGMKTQFGRSPTNASQQGQQFSYPGSQQEIPLIGTQPGFNSLPSLSNQVQGNFQKMNNQGNVGGQQTLGQTGGHQLANQQIAQSIPSGGTQKIQSSQQTLPQMGNQFNDSKQQIGSNPQQSQGNMSYQNQNQPMMYNPQIPQLNQQYGGIGGQVPYTGVEQSGVNAQVNQSKNPQQTQLPFQQQSFHPNQTPNYPQQQWQGQQSLNQGNSQNYIPPKDQSFGYFYPL